MGGTAAAALLLAAGAAGAAEPRRAGDALFAGRVARIDREAGTVRFDLAFNHAAYLVRKDRVEFFNEGSRFPRCRGVVVGKGRGTALVKVERMPRCAASVNLARGARLGFRSADLAENVRRGRELVRVLLRKRLAVSGMAMRARRAMESHIEKVEAVNGRYDVLRRKLEAEWQERIHGLEEDRLAEEARYEGLVRELDGIDAKLGMYRIDDEAPSPPWALDPGVRHGR